MSMAPQIGFGLAVLFRLYQEVWSNALVVGGFYGASPRTHCADITKFVLLLPPFVVLRVVPTHMQLY